MDGALLTVLAFSEKGTGHLMTGAAAIGKYWIDGSTGAVHQTELGFVIKNANIHAQVKFTKDAGLGVFVPSELFEQVEASSPATGVSNMGGGGGMGQRQGMEGRASYSKYRRVDR